MNVQRNARLWEFDLGKATLTESIVKMALMALMAREAGFTIEQLLELFDAGIEMDTMLELIAWRLEQPTTPLARVNTSSGRVA